MGFLTGDSGAAKLFRSAERIITPGADKLGIGASGHRLKQAKIREQVDSATRAMNEAARKQQIDLVSQAQAVAEAQTNMAMRQAVENKVAAMANKPVDQVDVSLTDPTAESPNTQRVRRRKQFFNEGGYTPGVSL